MGLQNPLKGEKGQKPLKAALERGLKDGFHGAGTWLSSLWVGRLLQMNLRSVRGRERVEAKSENEPGQQPQDPWLGMVSGSKMKIF